MTKLFVGEMRDETKGPYFRDYLEEYGKANRELSGCSPQWDYPERRMVVLMTLNIAYNHLVFWSFKIYNTFNISA